MWELIIPKAKFCHFARQVVFSLLDISLNKHNGKNHQNFQNCFLTRSNSEPYEILQQSEFLRPSPLQHALTDLLCSSISSYQVFVAKLQQNSMIIKDQTWKDPNISACLPKMCLTGYMLLCSLPRDWVRKVSFTEIVSSVSRNGSS